MMTAYILRLLILLPLVAGLAWGALYLWKRMGGGFLPQTRAKRLRVVDAVPLGTAGRLALVEFDDRALLLSVSRAGVTLVAEGKAGAGVEADGVL
ncbi:flagellar biogenesis protein FliO [Sphingomonas gilva]|uniref:Flagellar biogenesis protein FliO n=1 Tax=Sphingomonas gilva TaxID=2305907 RepID=A0A396S4U7_9SPHN|nr:flagellar biosynthetic protein FliO [Sphingomonas gilva]RHW18455.1 flagellar biogenesis protein FliO [Sphingomonas gilva]